MSADPPNTAPRLSGARAARVHGPERVDEPRAARTREEALHAPTNGTIHIVLHGAHHDAEGLREAVGRARADGFDVEVSVTWEAGDAARYAAEAAGRSRVVVAAGGDGTVREVAGALAGKRGAALAVLPLGTANDFAAGAGVPVDDVGAALNLALTGGAGVRADVVRAGEHVFVNVATGGPVTRITVDTPDGLKRLLGGWSYALTGAVTTAVRPGSLEPQIARVRGRGFTWEGSLLALAVGNGSRAGGGIALCPDARIDDGLLDVRIVPEGSGAGAMLLEALVRGRDAVLDDASFAHQTPWVEVETEEPLPVNLDGEPVEGRRFRFVVDPGAIRMVVPTDCPLLVR